MLFNRADGQSGDLPDAKEDHRFTIILNENLYQRTSAVASSHPQDSSRIHGRTQTGSEAKKVLEQHEILHSRLERNVRNRGHH